MSKQHPLQTSEKGTELIKDTANISLEITKTV